MDFMEYQEMGEDVMTREDERQLKEDLYDETRAEAHAEAKHEQAMRTDYDYMLGHLFKTSMTLAEFDLAYLECTSIYDWDLSTADILEDVL